MLSLYNSLTRSKEDFKPLTPGKIKLYVCGMTVYDYCHLGHARVLVVFDIIVRHLRQSGFDVTYVRNITDIDDKIIARAVKNGETIQALTERFITAMHEDSAALSILPPDHEPRATESMPQIISMIETLVEKEFAYQGDNGDVYYSVNRFAGYGQLSGKQLDDLRSGARVEVDASKQDPLDFVLWKSAKPGEPSWSSPWGEGRPGWHIECSAMSTDRLGAHFDIHGGGMDLQFPHHENEIAQSEAATGHPFVNYWLHNGFVQVNEEKMSKSLGNFFTVREILKQYQPEVVRYFILSSHYRSPLSYTDDNLAKAHGALQRLYTALRGTDAVSGEVDRQLDARFSAAMDDDFNTPEALAVLFDTARAVNRAREEGDTRLSLLSVTLRQLGARLGLLQADAQQFLQAPQVPSDTGLSDSDIKQLIEARLTARANQDWAEADNIRNRLIENNILLEDSPEGTTWRRS